MRKIGVFEYKVEGGRDVLNPDYIHKRETLKYEVFANQDIVGVYSKIRGEMLIRKIDAIRSILNDKTHALYGKVSVVTELDEKIVNNIRSKVFINKIKGDE